VATVAPAPGSVPAAPAGIGAAPTVGAELGSVAARIVAHLIDLVFLIMAFALAGNVVGSMSGGLTESGFNLNGLPALAIMFLAAVAFFLYLVLFEGVFGTTVGKLFLGLRVKNVDGSRCSFGQALVRNLLRIVDAFPLYLVGLISTLVTEKKQRVGDLAAHTIVVAETPGAVKRVGAAAFLLVCLAGTVIGSVYVRRRPRVPRVTFAIVNFRFADSDIAPPRATAEYKPEDEIRMFYEVPGYALDEHSYVQVVTHNQVLAPDGKPMFETQTVEVRQKADPSSGPVNCNFHVTLPVWAPPGKYTVKIEAEDQAAHKVQSASFQFTVNAPPIETSPTLVAKNIEISTSPQGPALNPPALPAGQSVCLRFRILGAKANDKGGVFLTEDWSLLGPDGKTLFQRSDDTIVNGQFIYTPLFIPFSDSLNASGIDPGDYKFQVVLHDKIGNADFNFEQPFTVNKP
jgi:uncharacterized RDD family membrane protein YckC